jgi:hypothetical protein
VLDLACPDRAAASVAVATAVTALPITTALAATTGAAALHPGELPPPERLAALGVAIAANGPDAHHTQLVVLGRTAGRQLGSRPAIDVMVDRAAAPVVRQRAFAVVTSALLAATRSPAPGRSRAA